MKYLFLLVTALLFSGYIHAQSTDDYRSIVNNGNWDNPATWEKWDGAQWLAATDYPGQASGTGNVTISNGFIVNLNTSPANSIGSLVIEQGNANTYFDINSGGSLTVTGVVTIEAPNGGGACNKYITVYTGGQLTAGSITMLAPTGGTFPECALEIRGGTVNVNGNITMNYTGIFLQNLIKMYSPALSTLNMNAGTISGGGFFPSNGTVTFNNPVAQTIPQYPYRNLVINSGGTALDNAVTLTNDITIGGDLTVESTHALNLNGHTFTLNGNNATVNLNGNLYSDAVGAALLATGTGSGLVINNDAELHLLAPGSGLPVFNNYTLGSTSRVVYGSGDAQVVSNLCSYGILDLKSGGTTKTISASVTANDVYIHDGVTLDLDISGTIFFDITRSLYIYTTGILNVNNNLLSMIGTVDGNIFLPPGSTKSITNLQINKTPPAKVFVQNGGTSCDLDIGGKLTLNSGNFILATNTLTLSNASDADQLSGGNASAYIIATGDGRLVRKLQNTAARHFPVGTATNYLPVDIRSIDAAGDYAVNVFEGATVNGSCAGTPITDKSMIVDAIWNVDRLAGSGQAELGLYWNSSLEGTTFSGYNDNQIGISHYNGSSWENAISSSSSNSLDFSIASFSSFSPYGIGHIEYILPAKFGPVKAYEKQQGIQVDWKIYVEQNVSRYEIERSADGSSFNSIGTVVSLNISSPTDYGFFDADPLPGTSFYRIRSINMDGKSGLSSIVSVNLDKPVTDIILYPNPVINGILTLQKTNLAKGIYTLRILNSGGLQVMLQSFKHEGGPLTLQSQLNNSMPAGLYYMNIELNGVKIDTKKFTVQ